MPMLRFSALCALGVFVAGSAAAQPSLAFLTPSDGSAWVPGSAAPIEVSASDLGAATVQQVEFFANGISIGVDDAAPYRHDWVASAQADFDLTATATLSEGGPISAGPIGATVGLVRGEALLVVGLLPLGIGDQAIADRLATWGYRVTAILAQPSTGAEATGKQLVFISESVSSSHVASKYRNTTAPVICSEDYNYDEMAMTGLTVNVDYGFVADQTALVIEPGGSPLAAGLAPGRTTIFTAIGRTQWGIPNGNATIGATLDGDPSKATIFGYRGGAAMAGGIDAPARRTGFFLQDFTKEMTLLNADGLALFDAAVRWTGGKETDAAPVAPTDLQVTLVEPGLVQFTWSVTPDELDGVEIEEAAGGGAFTMIGRFTPDVTGAFMRLPTGARRYRLRGWNGNGYSAPSNEAKVVGVVGSHWGVE
ncbi:hypothetical protein GC173_06240 [bacterium]|nr:hypothetical protein [bacterium]